MSKTSYQWNESNHYTIYCEWTVNNKLIKHEFKYTGEYMAAIAACYKTVLGAKNPTFKIIKVTKRRE